jgi:hypothetical protein
MNRSLFVLALLLVVLPSVSRGAWYAKFDGIDGSVADNDAYPRPGDVFTDVNDLFVKSWTTSGDADDRPTEEVAFYYTPLNGSPPTLTPSGWSIDSTFNFTYSIDLRRGNDPFTTHTGTGTARVIGTAPLGEPRVFETEMISFDISGSYLGVSPFLIRESPTIASTGQAVIESLPSGQYRIDSFFDVFTEMSVDGGQTWFPMVPEPSTVVLMMLAVIGTMLNRRRWLSTLND